MIDFTTINILGQPYFILDLKTEYKIFKNIPTVSEDCLRIAWTCMKIALIVQATT